jgi:glutamate-1-semialdehyde 2,1-aminomutase
MKNVFTRAQARIPGGVNSPVRSWKAVGGDPKIIAHGQGAYILDLEGHRYIDYVGSWGPLILGHAPAPVVAAAKQAIEGGMSFGAPTEAEVELAELVHDYFPAIEKLRLVSSGTEATMSAIRLARAYTGRSKIVKFDGCYHGHVDSLLVRAGSGLATLALPDTPGVPENFTRDTLVIPYNDVTQLESLMCTHPETIAAVIIEPVCGNMGVIPPRLDYLAAVRRVTEKHGAVLIFDEVITGFRVARGGAQELYGVTPDLTCLGKVLGGGLPVGAFGGQQVIMDLLAPVGPVYQAGTLSGNPVTVAAGLATLKVLGSGGVYEDLEAKGQYLEEALIQVLKRCRLRGTVNRVGSMLTLFFGVDSVTHAEEARRCDQQRFARFFHRMIACGIYYPPSPFEAAFISLAHSKADLEQTVHCFEEWAQSERDG